MSNFNLVKKGCRAYSNEAIIRKIRIQKTRARALYNKQHPELTLTNEEVEEIMRAKVVKPFAVIWHLVNS